MQTILGAGGAISIPLAQALTAYTPHIRLVGRNPRAVNATDELVAADLLNREQTLAAVAGSEVVYLTAGLTYNIKVWKASWPILIKNVIEACQAHGAKLVFFDNVYSYGLVQGPMVETTPLHPSSKKGMVRKGVVESILEAVETGRLTAQLARAADFYGPNVALSILDSTLVQKYKTGAKGQWIGGLDKLHSFTYTPDAASATALLGNTADAWNQTWHLPTAPPLTGQEWVNSFAEAFGVPPRVQPVGKGMMRVIGLFVPIMREFIEMMYQYENDYHFDSTKFTQRFGITATPYHEAIAAIVKAAREH